MTVLISVGTVIFLILSALLVLLILLQSDKSAGMGILGGSSQSTFGSSTADIITKITGVMVGIFMLGSLGLAVMESYRVKSVEKAFITPVLEKSDEGKKQDTGANNPASPVEAKKANK